MGLDFCPHPPRTFSIHADPLLDFGEEWKMRGLRDRRAGTIFFNRGSRSKIEFYHVT